METSVGAHPIPRTHAIVEQDKYKASYIGNNGVIAVEIIERPTQSTTEQVLKHRTRYKR